MAVDKIKKRNGAVVEFDRVRIERAMEKAFRETEVATTRETLEATLRRQQFVARKSDRHEIGL